MCSEEGNCIREGANVEQDSKSNGTLERWWKYFTRATKWQTFGIPVLLRISSLFKKGTAYPFFFPAVQLLLRDTSPADNYRRNFRRNCECDELEVELNYFDAFFVSLSPGSVKPRIARMTAFIYYITCTRLYTRGVVSKINHRPRTPRKNHVTQNNILSFSDFLLHSRFFSVVYKRIIFYFYILFR